MKYAFFWWFSSRNFIQLYGFFFHLDISEKRWVTARLALRELSADSMASSYRVTSTADLIRTRIVLLQALTCCAAIQSSPLVWNSDVEHSCASDEQETTLSLNLHDLSYNFIWAEVEAVWRDIHLVNTLSIKIKK